MVIETTAGLSKCYRDVARQIDAILHEHEGRWYTVAELLPSLGITTGKRLPYLYVALRYLVTHGCAVLRYRDCRGRPAEYTAGDLTIDDAEAQDALETAAPLPAGDQDLDVIDRVNVPCRCVAFTIPLGFFECIAKLMRLGLWKNKSEMFREALRDLFVKHGVTSKPGEAEKNAGA